MSAEDAIISAYKEYFERHKYNTSKEFYEKYSWVTDETLRLLLSTFHYDMNDLFSMMNTRLPTIKRVDHYWANESRHLKNVIDISLNLYHNLKDTEFAFDIDEYYLEIMQKCRGFLSPSGGSEIPINMEKITIYYEKSVFNPSNNIILTDDNVSQPCQLKCLGNGSYATVYVCHNPFYDKDFALKCAKKEISESDLIRFKREFEKMKELSSLHIAEVYRYNDSRKEYTMELLDYTLEEYIKKNNSSISMNYRLDLCFQILNAFEYLHSKKIFHRDVSLRNIMIKAYEDSVVVKITDFGQVKIEESSLTTDTDFKGSFNDPSLNQEGMKNYSVIHEIYAITHVIYFVLTGKIKTYDIPDQNLKSFVDKGMNLDKTKRFSNVCEMKQALNDMYPQNKL